MIEHMKQLLVEVDDDTFRRLEQIAPARSRRRSAFIRTAIQKAIGEEQERATAEAYGKMPDTADDAWFDPRVWEPPAPASRGRRRR
jgi:predicted transcriptional regulator